MTSIVQASRLLGGLANYERRRFLRICIFFLIPFTGLYVSLGGLWGVLWTDLFQFVLKMGIVIARGVLRSQGAGGMDAMLGKARGHARGAGPRVVDHGDVSRFFARTSSEAMWTLPVITFIVYLGIQWWAFWYPGAEPGGGGYIAQRIFSARNERERLFSVLWFNIAHYALRPWPWILTALAAPRSIQVSPSGIRLHDGRQRLHAARPARVILIAGFMAAFMSTIATQLNWGSSYLVADFYRRFLRRNESEKHYVHVSQVATLLLVVATGYVSAQLASIRTGLASGAGIRRRNWQSLFAAMVLVAHQCLERNFRHGYFAVRCGSVALGRILGRITAQAASIRRIGHGSIRKERADNHPGHHNCLARSHILDPPRTRCHARILLSQSQARRDRLEASSSPSSRHPADSRSRREHPPLDPGLRDGLLRVIRRRQIVAGPSRRRRRPIRDIGSQCGGIMARIALRAYRQASLPALFRAIISKVSKVFSGRAPFRSHSLQQFLT